MDFFKHTFIPFFHFFNVEWITINCGKYFKRWEYQTTLHTSCKTCMHVKKQQLKPDMEQQIGSKLGKEYIKAVCCHPAYLTSMPSTSCDMPGWMRHKLESRLLGEISICRYSYADDYEYESQICR